MTLKGSVTHLQNIVGNLKKKYGLCNLKWKDKMSNYEITNFTAIMQCLIGKWQFSSECNMMMPVADKQNKSKFVLHFFLILNCIKGIEF